MLDAMDHDRMVGILRQPHHALQPQQLFAMRAAQQFAEEIEGPRETGVSLRNEKARMPLP